MPKRKNPRKPMRTYEGEHGESRSTILRKRLIKWASITVIVSILLSLMIAAISVSPASAAEATPSAACIIPDTDGDAITNDIDPDLDGDEIVNGLDDDIDGDKVLNADDGDPASTNCDDSAIPPILPGDKTPDEQPELLRYAAALTVLVFGLGYIVLRRIRRAKK